MTNQTKQKPKTTAATHWLDKYNELYDKSLTRETQLVDEIVQLRNDKTKLVEALKQLKHLMLGYRDKSYEDVMDFVDQALKESEG